MLLHRGLCDISNDIDADRHRSRQTPKRKGGIKVAVDILPAAAAGTAVELAPENGDGNGVVGGDQHQSEDTAGQALIDFAAGGKAACTSPKATAAALAAAVAVAECRTLELEKKWHSALVAQQQSIEGVSRLEKS